MCRVWLKIVMHVVLVLLMFPTYASSAGWNEGECFSNLVEKIGDNRRGFIDPKYQAYVIKFWASWCAKCVAQIEDTMVLENSLEEIDKVKFLVFPFNESYEVSNAWIRKNSYKLSIANPDNKSCSYGCFYNTQRERIDYEPKYLPLTFILDENACIVKRSWRMKSKDTLLLVKRVLGENGRY